MIIQEWKINYYNYMDRTNVVNISVSEYDVYIGRPSKWGNPFKIGKDGSRKEVIEKYENYIRNNKKLINDLKELKNKKLGCFCKPKNCHGDILVKIINEFENEKTLNIFFNEE